VPEKTDDGRARAGANGPGGARRLGLDDTRPTEPENHARCEAQKSALARRHEGARKAGMGTNGLTSEFTGLRGFLRRSGGMIGWA